MTKIYFATSIVDCTPQIRKASEYILSRLQKKGEVLSAHVVDDMKLNRELANKDLNLYERDMLWVSQADCLVGEFTIPGGSYVEYQQASISGIPILGLHQRERISPMIAHNRTKLSLYKYAHLNELDFVIDSFFDKLPLFEKDRGKFIVLDGIDGCGKDTQASLLERYLISRDKAVPPKLTREPWYKNGRELRTLFQDQKNIMNNGRKIVDLLKENREDHLMTEIIPARNRGMNVISIRYKYSTLAYQGSQGVDPSEIVEANKNMLPADLALILDISEEESLKRCLADRATPDLFDKLMPLKKSQRQFYLDMQRYFPQDNIIIINGNQSQEKVFTDIKKEVDKIITS